MSWKAAWLFYTGVLIDIISASKQCRQASSISGMALQGFVFKKFYVTDIYECDMSCKREITCQSFNYVIGENSCELNNRTKEARPENFQPDSARFYYTRFVGRAFKNCAEIYKSAGKSTDGIYTIKPDNMNAFEVFCDQTTAGGGWTVFQRRLDGSVGFYRNWSDYRHGFGDVYGEFWLGLDKIHRLTSDNNSMLRVDLEDFKGNTTYAEYNIFGVMSEKDKYRLILGFYSGSAGDSLSYHRDRPWSTPDQDNDEYPFGNCAEYFHGAWWYKRCSRSNLNGRYHRGNDSSYAPGVTWREKERKRERRFLKRTEMKIRPADF